MLVVRIRKSSASHQSGGHRCVDQLGKLQKFFVSAGTNDTATNIKNRLLRLKDHLSSSLNLSNVAQKALAQPSFDRAKVDAIKKAIQDGTYAIDPKRIASSFVSLEKLIAE